MTTLSSRQFNQRQNRARKAAESGPVFIVEDGKRAFVLLTMEEYRKLGGASANILDLRAMPDAAEIDFDPPRLDGELFRPADL